VFFGHKKSVRGGHLGRFFKKYIRFLKGGLRLGNGSIGLKSKQIITYDKHKVNMVKYISFIQQSKI